MAVGGAAGLYLPVGSRRGRRVTGGRFSAPGDGFSARLRCSGAITPAGRAAAQHADQVRICSQQTGVYELLRDASALRERARALRGWRADEEE